jgi:hypothetical protein
MNSFQTSATNNATGAADEGLDNQAQSKSYTQEEVDNMMARMRGSLEKKLLKPYEDLGDPNELRQIRQDYEKKQQADQIKRGEFEKTLQELAQKKDAEIQKRDQIIKEYKVNTPLVSAAAKFKAVAPEQVKQLLINRVRLNDMGDVEVLDDKGTVKYNDGGTPYQVDDLVREFLDSNPHFVSANPSTTHSRSNSGMNMTGTFDLSKLDLSNPGDRKRYAEAKKSGIIK